mmetsp:Transcript_38796/g.61912  ORF Transcript_38796/g.61912 Transcript_38796/m.61912 type:complete len:298 (+) Transcript_38796:80-973(+)
MSSLRRLQKAENHYKYAVFGYVNQIERQYHLTPMPNMVAYLCLSYYFVPEQISNSINQLHISDDRLTASHCDQNKCSVVHFHRWFQSTSNLIASWTFKINELHKDGKLFFGFVSEEIKQMDRNFPPRFKSEEHAMYLMTESHTAFAQCDGNLVGSDNGVYLRCDDTVVITLDLQEQQIRQQVLGLQEEVVFSNIKKSEGIKYKMASILCSHGDSLTLQKCEIMHRSPIKDPGAPELPRRTENPCFTGHGWSPYIPCTRCWCAKTRCSARRRPCDRCIRFGQEQECQDRPPTSRLTWV